MGEISSKIEKYLKGKKVDYEPVKHEAVATAEDYNRVLGIDSSQQAKVLLLRYKGHGEKGYVVVALQATKNADLNHIKELIGASKIRMADKDQLLEVTGCKFGELHIFAKMHDLKLLMDKDLLEEEKIYINAGSLEFTIAMDPKTVQAIEEPTLF